ncbi:hypothetical protein [Bacillus wiedmannii]|uniref:hypothetical protein n=1 Tax=Bacillus wiedmannii TaxID=1890302 RepID=UPI000BF796AE|nr:hypothetical protein [Bacillus wiedmannii]PGA35145.1 hypothetical protein COL74_06875 [Bacillus wiedmannii]PHB96721.1 hypothetical protein COE96_15110 [Bacillus wiedmannii]
MEKPQKLKKHYTFQHRNNMVTDYLEELFCPSGIGSLPDINKEEIQEIEEALSKIAVLKETGMLGHYMEQEDNEYDLVRLESQLRHLADTVHNLNHAYTPRERNTMKYSYPNQFDHFELYHMKHEILGDILQTILTIYNVTQEEELDDENKLYYIQYVSQAMTWLIDKGYRNLFLRDMTKDEIDEVLSMKALCRIYEDKMIVKDFYTGNFYRSFAKDKEKKR